MSWWAQPSPWGEVVVECGPNGVRRVRLPGLGHDLRPEGRPRPDAGIAGRFDAYLRGRSRELDVPFDLDAAPLAPFQRHVLVTLRREVPWGETVTYGELAEIAGRPGAARAVGTAMARNPVPFVIPCHRVVAAHGIGGYGGGAAGVELKRSLLDREGRVPPSG
jgi:methylated-DNA-[protein]-cysteine S-methyltransferase